MYYYYSSTQLCLPAGSVIVCDSVDEVARARYIHMSIDVVSMYLCMLALVCLKYMYTCILPLVVCSTPLVDRECPCVDEVACSIHIEMSIDIFMYICTLASELHMCIATIRLLNSACWVGVRLCGRSYMFYLYIYIYGYCRYHIYILLLFDIYIYVSDIYIYTATIRECS